ncbi:MAG: peptide-methionine (R)-S-oxide reductase MsrB [Pyrinomonadaceae bacterium]
MKHNYLFAFSLFLVAVIVGYAASCTSATPSQPADVAIVSASPEFPAATTGNVSDDVFNGEKIVKSDDEWRKILTPEQFHILREEGTERSYTGEYNDNHEDGDYYCAACHLKLFSSKTKFESGTGWPSFYQPINAKNVTEKTDNAFGVTRTEIECSRCGSHLGHVFDDGPKPTGLRYCMNSLALKFEKAK